MDTAKKCMESGAWVGRQQAFAVIASKCSAAQAVALKEIKESRAFDQLGLTWQQFCLQYVGVSRERADALIRQYDEFGEAYFRLSQLARISPETYRQVAPKVDQDNVEIGGETLALTIPNAGKIRAAIRKMRGQLIDAQRAAGRTEPVSIVQLRDRHDLLIEEARQLTYYFPPDSSRKDLIALTVYAIKQWKKVSREFTGS